MMENIKLPQDMEDAMADLFSMRTKAAGMLAITQFPRTIQQFTNFATGALKVKFHADN